MLNSFLNFTWVLISIFFYIIIVFVQQEHKIYSTNIFFIIIIIIIILLLLLFLYFFFFFHHESRSFRGLLVSLLSPVPLAVNIYFFLFRLTKNIMFTVCLFIIIIGFLLFYYYFLIIIIYFFIIFILFLCLASPREIYMIYKKRKIEKKTMRVSSRATGTHIPLSDMFCFMRHLSPHSPSKCLLFYADCSKTFRQLIAC